MAQLARYSCTYTPTLANQDRLQPDDNQYYKCTIGAFNTANHNGVLYPFTPSVKALFDVGGIVRRRLDAGLCKGEYGHPKIDNMDLQTALRRLAIIEPTLTSHTFRSVSLEEARDEYGKGVILVIGEVKPTGPYGDCLNKQLSDREENVAFSIRSFTNNTMINGTQARIVKDVLTWDYVIEPGISCATQFKYAALEELVDDFIITEQIMEAALNPIQVAGLENDFSTLRMIRTNLGWEKVQVVNTTAIDWT